MPILVLYPVCISIRALLAEGDSATPSAPARSHRFQSAPSLRRATPRRSARWRPRCNFNPRPPCGGRPQGLQCPFLIGNFNPRPPCGGRPFFNVLFTSISNNFNPRPPCGGRRCGNRKNPLHRKYFNPRPPCGGRHKRERAMKRLGIFQSAPSLRRATLNCLTGHDYKYNFNPRPPCGGRLLFQPVIFSPHVETFQSAPSLRRATISNGTQTSEWIQFQSAPSLRRATSTTPSEKST